MEPRALLFDVNGTLIDIETDEGLEEVYRAIGHYLTYQGVSLHRGEVRDLYFQVQQEQRAASRETYPEWDAVAVWKEVLQRSAGEYTWTMPLEKLRQIPVFLAELHRGVSRKRLRLYPQVREVLDQLRGRFPMAVITDAQSAYAVPELRAVGLASYFDPVIVSGDYGYRKPDARLFQHALTRLRVGAEHALFIGDDLYRDVYGAQQLGIKTIFFASRPEKQSDPAVQPDQVIYHFAELLQAIEAFVT